MSVSKDHVIPWLYIKSDALAVVLAWFLSYYLRFHGPFTASKGIPDWIVYLKLTPFIIVIWFAVFSLSQFYQRGKSFRNPLQEGLSILRASAIAMMFFIALTYFYEEYHYSRLTLLFFAVLEPTFVISGRSLLRKALRVYRRNYPARKILLIGGGKQLEKAIQLAYSLDLGASQLTGCVPVSQDPEEIERLRLLSDKTGAKLWTRPEDWILFFHENPSETVLFCVPEGEQSFLKTHLEAIAEQVPDVKVIPDLSYLDRFNSGMDLVLNSPVIHVHDSPLKGIAHFQKRALDILGSLAAILIFSPVLLLVSILVKLSSPGKIFYKQERMGLDGRTFSILKFRSMPENAETQSGAVWAKKDDWRSTNLGKWLRKTSLDELPQLFNVLAGHMSLVGPRPERPVFVAQFRRSVPGYMLRHKVKAGMTGWAQINGWRGNTSIEKRIEADLYYIQNWSVWLDIKILFLTIFRGFINTNAY